MGDGEEASLKLKFDPKVRLEFHGATITSDAGLLAARELDEALGLTEMARDHLKESRTGHSVHTDVYQAAHLLQVLLGGPPTLGFLPSHYPAVDRRQRHVANDIHSLGNAVHTIQELGEGHPVPRHPQLHRSKGG